MKNEKKNENGTIKTEKELVIELANMLWDALDLNYRRNVESSNRLFEKRKLIFSDI